MGIAERKEREKLRRQNDILDAAEEVFLAVGLRQTTMDEIAEKAELSKGTLYTYFKNKESIFMGISLRALKALRERFETAARAEGDRAQQLMGLGQAYIDFAADFPLYFSTMSLVESLEMKESIETEGDPLARQCHEAGMGVLGLLAEVIKKGQEEGYVHQEIDPWKTSIVLWAAGNGVIQMEQNKGRHFQEIHGHASGFLADEYMSFCARALLKNPIQQ